VKLAHWSLHVYRLPYVREVTWVYAAENSGDYALLTLVSDNGLTGIAEGVIKPTRTGYSARSLATALETVVLPQLENLSLEDSEAVSRALARIPENRLGKAMVDNACWTLRAAAAEKPLWQLLGGKREVDLAYMVTRQSPSRMAAEAGNPDTALAFLEARLTDTHDPEMREVLANRMKEVIIERDLFMLESAVEAYRMQYRALPATLTDLVVAGALPSLPQEPFGGDYRLDPKTGSVSSSTHPERLRTFFKRPPPAYSFPRTRE